MQSSVQVYYDAAYKRWSVVVRPEMEIRTFKTQEKAVEWARQRKQKAEIEPCEPRKSLTGLRRMPVIIV